MSYVLESVEEAKRLNEQEKIKHYSIESEFGGLSIKANSRLLDAGCGHGMLSRYMSDEYHCNVYACDISDTRIAQAKKNNPHDIKYHKSNIENLNYDDEYFDNVCSRYVYEYMPDPIKASKELHRVLKKDGVAYITDLDGVFGGLKTSDKNFNKQLSDLCESLPVDVFVGKKLINFLTAAGFSKIKEVKTVHHFVGVELLGETENNRQRLWQSRPFFVELIGEKEFEIFADKYLHYMTHKDSNYTFNKHYLMATK
jgi:ubiquinone/menaquinone biosynthesis C-methylase UbiE